MVKKILGWLVRNEYLVIILALTVLLKVPSWFEPYWYGDEGIYLVIGRAIRQGVQLYSQIHDNKPPLLYLMAAVAGGSQFWFKMLATGWNLLTVGMMYKLALKLADKKFHAVTMTAVFAGLLVWPGLEGNIANAEIFFLLPTITAIYLLWGHNVSIKRVFLAGLALGFSGLFKMPALLETGVWPLLWLVTGEKDWLKKTLILGGAVLLPIGGSMAYYFGQNAGTEYVTAAWAQNLPYLSSWKIGSAGAGIFSIKGRITAVCLLLVPILGLARRIGKRGVWLWLGAIITIFAALLSGRPYPHYLMQSAGVIAAAVGFLIGGRKIEKIVALGVILLAIAVPRTYKFYGYKTIDYYRNFISWSWGKKTTEEYFGWFNPQVNKNYQIAGTIIAGSRPNDRIFVWGDEPMVYALAKRLPVGKYTVKYHIKDFGAEAETLRQLTENPPKFVVDFGNEEDLPGLASFMASNYQLQTLVGGAKIYRLKLYF